MKDWWGWVRIKIWLPCLDYQSAPLMASPCDPDQRVVEETCLPTMGVPTGWTGEELAAGKPVVGSAVHSFPPKRYCWKWKNIQSLNLQG